MTCKPQTQPPWFRRLIPWITVFARSVLFRPLGLNRPNRPNIRLNEPTGKQPKGYPTGSPEQCDNNPQTKTQCAYCDGALGSFSEALTKRITKVFEFCTGCGVVVKVKLYHD